MVQGGPFLRTGHHQTGEIDLFTAGLVGLVLRSLCSDSCLKDCCFSRNPPSSVRGASSEVDTSPFWVGRLEFGVLETLLDPSRLVGTTEQRREQRAASSHPFFSVLEQCMAAIHS